MKRTLCPRLREFGAIMLVLVAAGLVSPQAAAAGTVTTVPSAVFEASGEGLTAFSTQLDPGTFSIPLCRYGGCETTTWGFSYSSGTGDVSLGGATTGSGDLAGGGDNIVFYFAVVGNHTGQVPVVLTASASTSVSSGQLDSAQAYADVSAFYNGFQGGLNACAAVNPNICAGDLINQSAFTDSTLAFNVDANQFGSNAAYIEVLTSGNADLGSFAASADPMISFAPGFDSSGLTLEFSPGTPPVPTPEPPSLILLGVALFGLALGPGHRQLRRPSR